MNKVLSGVVLLLVACSFQARADDTVSVCNGCADQVLRFKTRDLGNRHHTMTPFDAVTTPAYRDAVINTIFSENNLGPFYWPQDRVRILLSSITNFASIAGLKTPFTIINNIEFPDGSFFQVSWNFNARAYSYIEGSAHDAAGNPILRAPLTRAAALEERPTMSTQTPSQDEQQEAKWWVI